MSLNDVVLSILGTDLCRCVLLTQHMTGNVCVGVSNDESGAPWSGKHLAGVLIKLKRYGATEDGRYGRRGRIVRFSRAPFLAGDRHLFLLYNAVFNDTVECMLLLNLNLALVVHVKSLLIGVRWLVLVYFNCAVTEWCKNRIVNRVLLTLRDASSICSCKNSIAVWLTCSNGSSGWDQATVSNYPTSK